MPDIVKFWFDDPYVLIRNVSIKDLKADPKKQTKEELLNSITRVAALISFILVVFNGELSYMSIFIITSVACIVYYYYYDELATTFEKFTEDKKNTNTKCVPPSDNNPFMNATMADYLNVDDLGTITNRQRACTRQDIPEIAEVIDEKFHKNLFRDVDDVFDKMNAQRQFYTTPNTTIPNDRDAFVNWIAKSKSICKEESTACFPYEDPRHKHI